MTLRNSSDGYGAIPQILHWLTAALVLVAWMLGSFEDALPKGAARAAGLLVHVSAGLTIAALVVARILWRLIDRPVPTEPSALGLWMDRAGRFAHYALYALLLATPIAGVVLQFLRGDAVSLFGLIDIPSPWVANRAYASAAKEIHETLANALVILAALHAFAAIIHHWILRDRTLIRMLPH